MTVNHDVVGSSPTGGVYCEEGCSFFFLFLETKTSHLQYLVSC